MDDESHGIGLASGAAQWKGAFIVVLFLCALQPNRLQHVAPPADPEIVVNAPAELPLPPPAAVKKTAKLYLPIIQQTADRYQVEPALIKAIIMAESGYNPVAVSKKGAQGLMQLMPSTAQALGVKDAFDPEHNIEGGVRYFKTLLTRFDGDMKLALAAYNAGSQRVKEYKGVPPFKATRHYIKKVFRYYGFYKKEVDEGKVDTV